MKRLRCLLLVVLLCESAQVCVGSVNARQRPVLLVVHSTRCAPCIRFSETYVADPAFKAALQECFEMRELSWDIPAERLQAQAVGVQCLPSFVVQKGGVLVRIVQGFTDSRDPAVIAAAQTLLCEKLGVEWPARDALQIRPGRSRVELPQPSVPTLPPVEVPAQASGPGLNEVLAETQALKTQQAEAAAASEAARERLEAGHDSAAEQLQILLQRLDAVSAAPVGPASVPADVVPIVSSSMPATRSGGISAEMSGKWLKVGLAVLRIAAPETAIPGGAALAVAGFAASWYRRRRARRAPGSTASATADVGRSIVVPITVDRAAPPQVVHTETRFVDVQRDLYSEAQAWAIAQTVRKYPGATVFAETLQSLIKQYVNSQKGSSNGG